jgi:ABC-2 type transport system ATP-binding protein
VLEDPAFYPKLTARQNLYVLAQLSADEKAFPRIGPLLDQLGLADRADDKIRTYSHGMRQRLGLAASLLHEPELILLDEPATALDPAGIRDVRALLESLQEAGKTVFLSSHLLSEVEQLCDYVAVVSKGALVYQGSLAGLTEGAALVRVQIDEIDRAEAAARELGWMTTREADALLIADVPAREVNRLFADRGLYVHGISEASRKLEDVFLELTEETPDG